MEKLLNYDGLGKYTEEVKESVAEKWVSGSSEALLSDNYTLDTEPYVYRKGVGARAYVDEIVGGSVGWNQFANFQQGQIPSASNGITYSYTDGTSVLINGTATALESRSGWFGLVESKIDSSHIGHKFFFYPQLISGTISGQVAFLLPPNTSVAVGDNAKIGVLGYSSGTQIRGIISITNGTVCTNAKVTILCIDLTALFGTTIADYLYTLEQSTTGAGVSLFKSMFPNAYYPYNAGEIKSVTAESREVVGKNLFDESTIVSGYAINANGSIATMDSRYCYSDIIPVTAGATYTYSGVCGSPSGQQYNNKRIHAYANGVWKEQITVEQVNAGESFSVKFQIPSGANGIRISAFTSDTNVAVGETHTYPLDSLTLRGVPKLADGKIYYDGDIYSYDGTVTRRYGVVDLGSLTWNKHSSSPNTFYTDDIKTTINAPATASAIFNGMCSAYPITTRSSQGDKTISCGALGTATVGRVFLIDSTYGESTAEEFKSAMSGVYFVYELATPTTETADAFQHLQFSGSTEAFTGSEIPVGHSTRYLEDLKAKIEGLPWDLSMIAPIENGTTSSKAYAAGEYFLHNNQFCKAKTSIASGATFTLNTNYTVTTIGAELKSLA